MFENYDFFVAFLPLPYEQCNFQNSEAYCLQGQVKKKIIISQKQFFHHYLIFSKNGVLNTYNFI